MHGKKQAKAEMVEFEKIKGREREWRKMRTGAPEWTEAHPSPPCIVVRAWGLAQKWDLNPHSATKLVSLGCQSKGPTLGGFDNRNLLSHSSGG